MNVAYKRIILKISGEALAGADRFGLNHEVIDKISDQIIQVNNAGCEVCIVVGGGNFWRGRQGTNMDRATADYMGMLATAINALALQDALEQKGTPVRVQTAIEMRQIAEPYIRRRALRHLEKERIVIFACGTGNPYFSTDTTAALRAAEMSADVILLAKNVDGVYDSDPKTNQNAKKYEDITYKQVLADGLMVMDSPATALCMENNIPIVVFALNEENSIVNAVAGKTNGTLVHA
ncbi:MAG: UMP kinase [Clostridia bacterium]|nr:UMP kinase [Clostridia bacterium]